MLRNSQFVDATVDLFARYDGVWLGSVGLAIVAGLIAFTIRENRGGRLVPAAA